MIQILNIFNPSFSEYRGIRVKNLRLLLSSNANYSYQPYNIFVNIGVYLNGIFKDQLCHRIMIRNYGPIYGSWYHGIAVSISSIPVDQNISSAW